MRMKDDRGYLRSANKEAKNYRINLQWIRIKDFIIIFIWIHIVSTSGQQCLALLTFFPSIAGRLTSLTYITLQLCKNMNLLYIVFIKVWHLTRLALYLTFKK